MTYLQQGANLIVSRFLLQADGVTALSVSAVTSVKLDVFQNGVLAGSYTMDTSPELRAGAAANQVDFEITSAICAALARLPVSFRWTIELADADFIAEPGQQVNVLFETPLTIT